jgi:glyoxylase-like metal-dependent hydrolase (beta-lactamase superfamily II)
MQHRWIGFVVVAGLVQALGAQAPERPAPVKTQVADGVFLFQTSPYGEVGLDGNSVVIVSNDGVLVFDSNGTPAAAEAVLREIRAITTQPVRYVVNSHWHWDHWYGTEVYTRAFPGVQVIAHEKTRRMMMGPALAFNQPGLDTQLPGYIDMLEKRLASLQPSPEATALKDRIAAHKWFLDQKRGVHHTFPTLTFIDKWTLHLGDREVQVLHRDRAVTPGDAFLYLPKERVLVTGDLLVNPVSFALSVYPSGWVKTLEWMDALDAAAIVPGHGEVLRDETLLHATLDIFRKLIAFGPGAKARGLNAFQASDEVYPALHDLMVQLTHDDPGVNAAFRSQLVEWFMHLVYDELNGPLSDEIAPIPSRGR